MTHAVIFDIDDTLLHSMEDDDRMYREAIRDVVGPVTFRDSLSDYEHVSDSGILRQVLRDNRIDESDVLLHSVRERFFAALEAHVDTHGPFREIDGARQFIARLRKSGRHAVALATGCWRRSAELKLRTAGFEYGGLPLATSDDAEARIAIMQHALAALAVDTEHVTYYGDGIWDREACRQLGWDFRAVGPRLGGIRAFHDELTG